MTSADSKNFRAAPLQLREARHPDVLWASFFCVGFLRPAPGTWGSAAAALVWFGLLAGLPALWQAGLCVIYFVVSWWCSHCVCQRYGVHDASEIVADEVIGMWLALWLIQLQFELNWITLVAAFLLFRVLDVAKPGPVGWLDRQVDGGLGVMLDDVLAGLLTGIVVSVTLQFLPAFGLT